jgi:hypothetical protein
MALNEAITTLGLVLSAVGLMLVFLQLRQSANSATSGLLITINRDLNSFSDIAIWLESGDPELGIDAIFQERILDYISYFEGLYISHNRGLFSLREVDEYFSGRFFRLANHPRIQKEFLCAEQKYQDIFKPIFKLHRSLSRYRKRRNSPALFLEYDLEQSAGCIYRRMSASR